MATPDRHRAARILVVDDDAASVRTLEAILHDAGYPDVLTTTDGRAVEEIVSESVPDLILLDLRMPHLDGHALLERLKPLREREGYLPVLVLTGDPDPAARRRALELGATDYVTRPFDSDEVVVRCRNLLHTRQLYRRITERHATLVDELMARGGELRDARMAHQLVLTALDKLHPGASLEESAGALVGELSRTSEFDLVAIATLDPDGRETLLATGGIPALDAVVGRSMPSSRAPNAGQGTAGAAWGEPLPAVRTDEPLAELMRAGGVRSIWHVPITEAGRAVGMFSAACRTEPTTANLEARLPLVKEFGAIARASLGARLAQRYEETGIRQRLLEVIGEEAFCPVFQPVTDVSERTVIGYEALTRFADGVPPDRRFAEADRVGLGLQLEETTLNAALAAFRELPQAAWLSINASPALLLAEGRLARILAGTRRLVVVEITEHVPIDDYEALRAAIGSLGANVRVAIDDAGAGFASFRHVLELRPDFVKLDADLVHGIEADPSRQALVVGMRHFAEKTGCTLIAEGVETEEERGTLESLGIRFGQGLLFSRPLPCTELAAAVTA